IKSCTIGILNKISNIIRVNFMNEIKKKYILKYNKMRPNIHTKPDSKIDGFIQRGAEELNIKIRKRENKFLFYFYGERIGYMSKLLSSTTSKIAFKICKNKMMTEKLLADLNINTLESKVFNDQEAKEAHDSIMKS